MASRRNGARLITALNRIRSRIRDRNLKLRVGFLEGATYPDGTSVPLVAFIQDSGSTYPDGTSVPLVAFIQDSGSTARNIPPRPFFRNMIANKSHEWPDALRGFLQATDYDGRRSLELLGEGIAGQLRQSIVDTNLPPLAPATIQRKGFDKPLVDTGHMLNSVNKEVVEE